MQLIMRGPQNCTATPPDPQILEAVVEALPPDVLALAQSITIHFRVIANNPDYWGVLVAQLPDGYCRHCERVHHDECLIVHLCDCHERPPILVILAYAIADIIVEYAIHTGAQLG